MLSRRIIQGFTNPYYNRQIVSRALVSFGGMSTTDSNQSTAPGGDGKAPYFWPKLVVFGNSIVQRGFSREDYWVSEIGNLLVRKCDVLNRGLSGYNSRWNRIVLPRIVPAQVASEVVGMIIFLGANDSTLVEYDKEQHVPLDEYKSNLKSIVQYLNDVGIPSDRVLMIDPPPSDDEHWGKFCQAAGFPNNKCNIESEKYARACVQVAKECGADHISLWQNMSAQPNWREMLIDGLHLSPAGAEFLFSLIKPWCLRLTEHLPFLLPNWKDIDYLHPENSFP